MPLNLPRLTKRFGARAPEQMRRLWRHGPAPSFPRPQSSGIRRLLLITAPVLLTGGCVAVPPGGPSSVGPDFQPQHFFTGRTVGDGVLRIVLSRPRRIHVVGDGHVEPDGTLVLLQQVSEQGRTERHRVWRLRPLGDGRFAGTLSDASGPVEAEVRGKRLQPRYRAKGGLGVEQRIDLQPGGQAALNVLVVRKLGIVIAVLRETIRRQS